MRCAGRHRMPDYRSRNFNAIHICDVSSRGMNPSVAEVAVTSSKTVTIEPIDVCVNASGAIEKPRSAKVMDTFWA